VHGEQLVVLLGGQELQAWAGQFGPISSARRPPTMKNTNDVAMYMMPICFASVVRSSRTSREPLTGDRIGDGRLTVGSGRGFIVVKAVHSSRVGPRRSLVPS